MKSDQSQGYVTPDSDTYPAQLKVIAKPLPLYWRGSLALLGSKHNLAVVGSRHCTAYTKTALHRIFSDLENCALVITSGMALGTDALAHELALEHRLPTIAVLGSGLTDADIHPRTNLYLAGRILDSGGLLLSPFAPGTPIQPYNFPIRNQIIAALSDAVLVAAAAQKSGALITATLGLEYGKDVMAIPGNIDQETSLGCNNLLKAGAIPVTSGADILNHFELPTLPTSLPNPSTQVEAEIMTLLRQGALSSDQLIRFAQTRAEDILRTLTNMELKGWVRTDGQVYRFV